MQQAGCSVHTVITHESQLVDSGPPLTHGLCAQPTGGCEHTPFWHARPEQHWLLVEHTPFCGVHGGEQVLFWQLKPVQH